MLLLLLMQEFAPTPYTADQIRESCRPGMVVRYRQEAADGTVTFSEMEFVECTDEGCTHRTRMFDADNRPQGEPRESHDTWEELRDHARFPAEGTTIADEEVTVGAGTFACRLYTVRTEGGVTQKFWFANDRPGPPVKMVILQGDRILNTIALDRRTTP